MHTWKERIGLELSEVSAKEKLISTVGGVLSIFTLILFGRWGLDGTGGTCVIASMGATAVLLFSVPHGQLSQPWPVIAGHGFSAIIGVLCARYISHQALAGACAVGLAIGLMHQFKCIHPPGGATALIAVIGGPPIHDLGYSFVLFPILINAALMVSLAVLLNACFSWRRYPAFLNRRPPAPAPSRPGPSHEEVVAALKRLDSFVDITEDDLVRLCQMLSTSAPAKVEKKPALPHPGLTNHVF
ncbi:HPP family protein [Prosthecobacter sp. SYSU 5D2]|uniref:HPP family protein n=1 Tax=Prosthecobacter sp. SYSU 5D2 TaxID=3134134 RepID=UPI0031FF1E38